MNGVPRPRYGAIAIGRNEGERLRHCLMSLDRGQAPLTYVDSGSTDGSVALALSLGADVVQLETSAPFTAARARNEGYRHLLERHPALEFLFFVDGDCAVDATWISTALAFLDGRPDVVAVSGRRRERFPERSIYNRLCDLDWHWSVGETRSFGGDVVVRAAAMQQVGGYNPALIAGEEPELCIRLLRCGGKIWQLDAPMTLHDANIMHFHQWWRRGVRTGFAYAEGARMHGAAPERHWVRETRSACFWGLALPAVALLLLPWSARGAVGLAALYPLQMLRLYALCPLPRRQALLRAAFLVVGKFAEASGVLKYLLSRLQGARAGIIEYK